MKKYKFECMYCGNTWVKVVYAEPSTDWMQCEICKDKNIRVKKAEKLNTYGEDK